MNAKMIRRFITIALFLFVAAALSMFSFAFGRGGGGGHSSVADRTRDYSRFDEPRIDSDDRQQAETRSSNRDPAAADRSQNEAAAHSVITNPFVNPAANASRDAELNRNDYYEPYGDGVYRNPYYYGPWGPLGDWNTSSSMPNIQPAPGTP